MRLRRRPAEADVATTYDPPLRLKAMRAVVETFRLPPMFVTFAIGLAVLGSLQALARIFGIWWAALCGGLVLLAAGAIAGVITVAAKWLLVGRIRASEFPLWSSFVWRNEVADTFVETVAAPWFARAAGGTPVMNMWLRALGAHVGRGTWCETYWLPEADLVTLGVGATVNRGCVVQTHLFHDRIMQMDSRRPGKRCDPRAELRCVARRPAGFWRDRRSRIAGGARRRGAGVHTLAGQSNQAVEPRPQEGSR
jgi:non-ribosomal peptide synthetase-like protein